MVRNTNIRNMLNLLCLHSPEWAAALWLEYAASEEKNQPKNLTRLASEIERSYSRANAALSTMASDRARKLTDVLE